MMLVTNSRSIGYHHHRATLYGVSRRACTEGYNWHFFEESLAEFWVREKTGHIELGDGAVIFLRCEVKGVLQALIIPIIEAADRFRFLAQLVQKLARKLAFYYFYCWVRGYEKSYPGMKMLSEYKKLTMYNGDH